MGKLITDEELRVQVQTYIDANCNQSEAARILNIPRQTLQNRLATARTRGIDVPDPTFRLVLQSSEAAGPVVEGRVSEREVFRRPLPDHSCATYILTAAVNNSELHEPFWKNLRAFASHLGAELLVFPIHYRLNEYRRRGADTEAVEEAPDEGIWWPEQIKPHLCSDRIALAPDLHYAGDSPVTATAANPLSGYDTHTGAASGIFGATRVALRSVATVGDAPTKLLYTTGACTQRNYSETKTGQKADWHHVYGALIVEVDPDGVWFVRQLIADDEGTFQDLTTRVSRGKVSGGKRIKAYTTGDVHTDQLDPEVRQEAFGEGGVLDALKPGYLFIDDLHDHRRRSHHNRSKTFERLRLAKAGEESVEEELRLSVGLLVEAQRPWMTTVVKDSNHHDHLMRWLEETDWRTDPPNAAFYLDAASLVVGSIDDERFHLFEALMRKLGCPERVVFTRPDQSFLVDDVENALHGHNGPNGARGAIGNLSKIASKTTIGHGHSAGIQDGCYQAGVLAGDLVSMRMNYSAGPSSWTRSGVVQYPNGKRSIVTWRGLRWRGTRKEEA